MSLSLASSVANHSVSRCSAASIGPAPGSWTMGGAAAVAATAAGGGTSHLLPLAAATAGRRGEASGER